MWRAGVRGEDLHPLFILQLQTWANEIMLDLALTEDLLLLARVQLDTLYHRFFIESTPQALAVFIINFTLQRKKPRLGMWKEPV